MVALRSALVVLLVLSACGDREEPPPPRAVARDAVLDEATDTAPAADSARPRVARLHATGDLVLNPHAVRALADDGDGAYDRLLAGYAETVDDASIAFLNLEQPLVDDVVPLDPGWPRQDPSRPRRSPVLGATPPLADALARAGVDVVSFANNHAYDQGRGGVERTLEELGRVGVAAVGAGADLERAYAPVIVERSGVRVAFVAFSAFFNQHPSGAGYAAARLGERERVAASLGRARVSADLVVACVHWSRDFAMEPRAAERAEARALVDAGADVVLGTGPHVLHPVERVTSPRGEAVVAYSLGNLVSGMGRTYRLGRAPTAYVHPANVRPEARDGVALRLDVRVAGSEVRVEAIEGVGLWTENNWLASRSGAPHRIRVRPLARVGGDVAAERAPVIAAALGEQVALRPR